MKIIHKKEAVSRATICQYHNISILDVQDLIKGAVNDSFTIDGLLYELDRTEKKPTITNHNNKVRANGITIEILEKYTINYPKGVSKKYVCDGEEYNLTDLCNKLGTSYDPLQLKLYKVQKFKVDDDTYELVVKGYLYDMIHSEYDNLYKVTIGTVCEAAEITTGTAKTYCKNGWYTKNGWRIRESE